MTFTWTLGPLYSGRRPPALELIARVVRMDHAADVPAPAEDRAGGEGVYREAGEHEFALTAAELGVVGTPVVGGRLRESLDHWHVRAFPSMGLADPTVPSGRERTQRQGEGQFRVDHHTTSPAMNGDRIQAATSIHPSTMPAVARARPRRNPRDRAIRALAREPNTSAKTVARAEAVMAGTTKPNSPLPAGSATINAEHAATSDAAAPRSILPAPSPPSLRSTLAPIAQPRRGHSDRTPRVDAS